MPAPLAGLRAGVIGAASLLAACNGILGIDEATFDPNAGRGASEGGPGVDASDAGPIDTTALYALNCANYCSLVATYCVPSLQGDNTEYIGADGGVCMQMCQVLEVSGEMITPAHEPADTNTLNCRVWHANAARLGTPHVHCPHAGPLGGDVCDDNADPCVPFCAMDLAFCTGPNAVYASNDECLAACRPNPDAGYAGYPYQVSVSDPEVTDLQSGGNTLNCRIYHLENYLNTGDSVHCHHTSRDGFGVCVAPPDGG
jgi:hypothetical protein